MPELLNSFMDEHMWVYTSKWQAVACL